MMSEITFLVQHTDPTVLLFSLIVILNNALDINILTNHMHNNNDILNSVRDKIKVYLDCKQTNTFKTSGFSKRLCRG